MLSRNELIFCLFASLRLCAFALNFSFTNRLKNITAICIPLSLLFLTACGYRWQEPTSVETFTLTPVLGDEKGYFGRALAMSLVKQSGLDLLNEGGDLLLEVTLRDPTERNVGFHYERSRKGKLEDELFPIETRLFLEAEVRVYHEGECLSVLLEADYTFDHNYNSAPNRVNLFSLGQLTDYDEAYDVALESLYKKLADKIADWVGLVVVPST